MVAIRWETWGRVPPLFSDGGDIIYYVTSSFFYVLYLERFQNKSDICHVLCEAFHQAKGVNLAEGGH